MAARAAKVTKVRTNRKGAIIGFSWLRAVG